MSATHTSTSPIFVVGAPRSGTTLLATLLNRHQRIAAAPESHYIRFWMRKHPGDPASDEHFERFWRAFSGSDRFKQFELDANEVRERIERVRPRTWRSVFDGLMSAYAEARGRPRWAEKTPDHFQHLPRLFEWYPDARVLFVVRDPRAVAASTARSPWGNDDYAGHAYRWRRSIGVLEGLAGDERVMRVRYEDLVTDPEPTLRAVCEHIGEAFDPAMLEAGDEATPGAKAGSAKGEWAAEHFRRASGAVNTESLEKWRKQMSPAQVRDVEAVAGHKLREQGYEASEHAPGAIGRMGVLFPLAMRRVVFRATHKVRGVTTRSEPGVREEAR